jgi:hypothetical protein
MIVKGFAMSATGGSPRYKAISNLEVTTVPDGFVIYDDPKGKVHYLNPTAAVLYSICDVDRSVDEMQEFLRAAYDLDGDIELTGFLEDLEKAGLICRTK